MGFVFGRLTLWMSFITRRISMSSLIQQNFNLVKLTWFFLGLQFPSWGGKKKKLWKLVPLSFRTRSLGFHLLNLDSYNTHLIISKLCNIACVCNLGTREISQWELSFITGKRDNVPKLRYKKGLVLYSWYRW